MLRQRRERCDLEPPLQSTCQRRDRAEQTPHGLWSQLGTGCSFCGLLQSCSRDWAGSRRISRGASPAAACPNTLLGKQQWLTSVPWSASCKPRQDSDQSCTGRSRPAKPSTGDLQEESITSAHACGWNSSPGPLPWVLLRVGGEQSKAHPWCGPRSYFSHISVEEQ